MNPHRWGYEELIVERPEAHARRIMVKEHFETPCWQISRDATLVVIQGAVQLKYGDSPDSLSSMWGQENDRVHLKDGSWYQLIGMMNTVVHEYSYGNRGVDNCDGGKSFGDGGKITEDEFRDLLLSYVMATTESGSVLDIPEATDVAEALAKNGRLIGMCNGCFDLIHPGHAELLLQAKQRCEVLFVALNTDSSTRRTKGDTRPVVSEEGRAIMLSSMKFVDHVVINDASTCVDVVKAIKPDVYVTTPNCAECAEAKATLAIGGRVEVVDPLPGWSTTKLVNQILEAR